MPVIKRFGAYVIRIYFDDHNPPHVHVVGANFEALVLIGDGTVMAGEVPTTHRAEAMKWIDENRALLLAKWDECH